MSGPTITKAVQTVPVVCEGSPTDGCLTLVSIDDYKAGQQVGIWAGNYAKANFGDTAYLLIDKGVEYTTLLGAYFKDAFTQAGGTIVLEDTYETDATDFSAQITKLKALPEQPAASVTVRV